MKMTTEDFKTLTRVCNEVLTFNKSTGESNKDVFIRLVDSRPATVKNAEIAAMWQLFHIAMKVSTEFDNQRFQGNGRSRIGFYGKLSAYLNDSHIETALKLYVKTELV